MESAWMRFLAVRKELINEFMAEGKSCQEIANILSMDQVQVWLISDRSNAEPAPKEVKEAFQKEQLELPGFLKNAGIKPS